MLEQKIQQANDYWVKRLTELQEQSREPIMPSVEGVLTRMVGLTLEAEGCQAPIGAQCDVITPSNKKVEAEVVGFAGEKLLLMPTTDVRGLEPNSRVIPKSTSSDISVGYELLGRVIDGKGNVLDNLGPLKTKHSTPLEGAAINPLSRDPIREPLDVGVRAINGLISVGRGQRMGLFAGSGVGKSVLLGMMTKYTDADIVVVGLIGERGREVKEFVDEILGEEGLKKSVVVAAPADSSPLMRIHGAMRATSIAEYFRDQGKNVLLLMDSLTRFAQAQREISLAIGEPPATKGYPPSVFARLPQLVERAGNGDKNGGSITAFYTVLVEGDDHNDPIADSARAILDGHIVLSRQLAEAGQFPAIDIEASISRLGPHITEKDHQMMTQAFKKLSSTYQQNKDLINVGAYHKGSDQLIDLAISMQPKIFSYLAQDMSDAVTLEQSINELKVILEEPQPSNQNQPNQLVSPDQPSSKRASLS